MVSTMRSSGVNFCCPREMDENLGIAELPSLVSGLLSSFCRLPSDRSTSCSE